MIRSVILATLIGGGSATMGAAATSDDHFRPQSHQIVCESTAFRRVECPADARGGVRLLQQTSGLCTARQTWGVTTRGLWVTNGCRAIFAVTPGAGGGALPAGRLIVCASHGRMTRCAASLRRAPRIEVIAGTCRSGRTWGWSRTAVWVDQGCRARFVVG